jgi:hypothetical protein
LGGVIPLTISIVALTKCGRQYRLGLLFAVQVVAPKVALYIRLWTDERWTITEEVAQPLWTWMLKCKVWYYPAIAQVLFDCRSHMC